MKRHEPVSGGGKKNQIYPAAPDSTVGGLLSLMEAQSFPLSAGGESSFCSRPNAWVILAALEGCCTAFSRSRHVMMEAGQAVAMQLDEDCTMQAVADCLGMSVILQGSIADCLLQEVPATEGVLFYPSGGAAVREAVLTLAVLEENGAGRVGAEEASARAYRLLMQLRTGGVQTEPAYGSDLVEAAVGIIQEEFAYLEGLDSLAERLEISRAYLSRIFTEKTGISPGRYLTRTRIEHAKLLLQDPDVTISYAAEASGFANGNYFAKVFRRETGMTPTEYLASAPRRTDRFRLL